jgi:hypothetical protein
MDVNVFVETIRIAPVTHIAVMGDGNDGLGSRLRGNDLDMRSSNR